MLLPHSRALAAVFIALTVSLAGVGLAQTVPLTAGDLLKVDRLGRTLLRFDPVAGDFVPWPGSPAVQQLSSLAVGPGGTIYASGSGKVWRLENGVLRVLSDGIEGQLAVSEAGLFVGTQQAVFRIDTESGEWSELAEVKGSFLLAGRGGLYSMRRTASSGNPELLRIDAVSGALEVIPTTTPFFLFHLGAEAFVDERTIYLADKGKGKLIDVVTGEIRKAKNKNPRLALATAMAISPLGGGIAVVPPPLATDEPGGVFRFLPDLTNPKDGSDDLDRGPGIAGPFASRVRDVAYGPGGRAHLLELTNKGYRIRIEEEPNTESWRTVQIPAQPLGIVDVLLDSDGTPLTLHRFFRPDKRWAWRVIGWDKATGEQRFRRTWITPPQTEDSLTTRGSSPSATIDRDDRISIITDVGVRLLEKYDFDDGPEVSRIEQLVPGERQSRVVLQRLWPNFDATIAALPDGDLISTRREGKYVRIDPRDGSIETVLRRGPERPFLLVGAKGRVALSGSPLEPGFPLTILDPQTRLLESRPAVPSASPLDRAAFDADCQILTGIGGDLVRLDPRTGEKAMVYGSPASAFRVVIPEPGRPELRCRLPRAR